MTNDSQQIVSKARNFARVLRNSRRRCSMGDSSYKLKLGKSVVFVKILATALAASTLAAQPAPLTGEPARVDLHGDRLPEGAVARLGTLRFRHGNYVHDLAYSPDGKLLASVASDGLRVWEAATGKERFSATLPGTSGQWFTSIAFSPDSKILVAAGWDGTIHRFDPASGKTTRSWRGHADAAWGVAFSRDGKTLISAGRDGVVRLWDWQTGKERMAFGKTAEMAIVQAALSPDGTTVVSTGSHDSGIHIWDAATGKKRRNMPFSYSTAPHTFFAPDGKTLVVVADRLSFWDPATGESVQPIQVPGKGICQAAFSPDGKIFAVAGYSGSEYQNLHCFDWATGKLLSRLPATDGGTAAFAFGPDGKTLAVSYQVHGGIRFFESETGKEKPAPPGHLGGVVALAFAPDGKSLFSAGDDSVRWWDLPEGKERDNFLGHRQPVHSLALSPDGKTLAAGSGVSRWPGPPGRILVWEVTSKKTIADISIPDLESVQSLAFAPNGLSLLSGARNRSGNNEVSWRWWSLPRRQELHRFKDRHRDSVALFSEDTLLMVCPADQSVALWDPGGATLRRKIRIEDFLDKQRTPAAALSPSGQRLALGDTTNKNDGDIHVFEVATGGRALRLTGHMEWLTCLAFAPDGRTLVSAGRHNSVAVWDLATGKPCERLAGHRGGVEAVGFSPSGKLLATGGRDTTVLLWDAAAFSVNTRAPAELSAEEREALWLDLAGPEAAGALRAVCQLAGDSQRSPLFIGVKMAKIALPAPEQIRAWLNDLDSDDFQVRERATNGLADAGKAAEPAMRKAQPAKKSLEFQRRIENILDDLGRKPLPPHLLQARRAVQVLEMIGTDDARKTLEELDRRGVGEAAGALMRLARREMAASVIEKGEHER